MRLGPWMTHIEFAAAPSEHLTPAWKSETSDFAILIGLRRTPLPMLLGLRWIRSKTYKKRLACISRHKHGVWYPIKSAPGFDVLVVISDVVTDGRDKLSRITFLVLRGTEAESMRAKA
jgi:hypothetical protein